MKTTYTNFAKVYNDVSQFRPCYSVSILQSAGDVIAVTLTSEAGANRAYWIPVKKCAGTVWKVNKKSIANDSGNAADLIQFLVNPENAAYLRATIRELIFSGNIKEAY